LREFITYPRVLYLSVDPPVPPDQEIEYRAQEREEDDDQYPDDFVIALEFAGQDTDQCHERQQDDEQDDKESEEKASAEKKKKGHGTDILKFRYCCLKDQIYE